MCYPSSYTATIGQFDIYYFTFMNIPHVGLDIHAFTAHIP